MSWKRKFEGAELEDENRDPKRGWNRSKIIQLGIHDVSAPSNIDNINHNGDRRIAKMDWTSECILTEDTDIRPDRNVAHNSEIICYGALCDAKAKLDCKQLGGIYVDSWEPFYIKKTPVSGIVKNKETYHGPNKPSPRAFETHIPTILGGIDADVMGLGKTLTMLSAIVCTMKRASEFGGLNPEHSSLPTTRATLVVTSSPRKFILKTYAGLGLIQSEVLMETWMSEVERHLKPGHLSLCVFHGNNKPKVVGGFINNDVVLTTYRTLESDWKSRGLLQKVMWFRVVLDEDFRPFSEPSFFRKHILEPLHEDSPDPFRNLKALMRITCFRRTSELLLLPQASIEEIAIELTRYELQSYEDVLSASKKEYDTIVDMRSTRKKYCLLFATTMKLRRLCNHGTFVHSSSFHELLSPNWNPRKRNTDKNSIEEKLPCAYCYDDDENFSMHGTTLEVCPECSRVLDNRAERASSAATSDSGNNSPGRALGETTRPIEPPRSPLEMTSGFSSKLNAVVDNILGSLAISKHLVFTSWRDTLDILQYSLAQRGINCLRMDGRTSFTDRHSILTQFRQDTTQNVLLLSIATGAVGLTLTVADRVHIVEPQWNPFVEEQAIGRAVRMGQDRSVKIYKYIAKNSVEQNIVTLQKRKNQLVKISLDACAGDQVQQGLEDLMFVIRRDRT
ncbi:hypothetical protein EKO27_g2508 [Xylaria grammica]|uniref:Helicase C-terminal domain-containing protein n=1 Tax=Xylaria grammica TaxID=363999 RepID=A0A439DDW3_9PEZI|nr:hypothetical protein EKO27_g2508 [Xylaria grammica]